MLTSWNRSGLFINKFFLTYRFSVISMMTGNTSFVTEFVLAALTDCPEIQLPLFYLFLTIYIVSMVGNFDLISWLALILIWITPCTITSSTSTSWISVTFVSSAPKCCWTLSLSWILSSMRGAWLRWFSFSFCHLWILHVDRNGPWLLCGCL